LDGMPKRIPVEAPSKVIILYKNPDTEWGELCKMGLEGGVGERGARLVKKKKDGKKIRACVKKPKLANKRGTRRGGSGTKTVSTNVPKLHRGNGQ